ncbi:MAG: SGNH/GDSL hydrolase family protein [Pyrinomonadaceae bacterium]
MSLARWQAKYVIGGALLLPIAPLLWVQGQLTRWKVGVLPGAEGEASGIAGSSLGKPTKLFVIGESTVAGLGARTHETAFAGQFAKQLSERIGRAVHWQVVGKNGVTALRTIDELLPYMPDETFDYILVGLGGNDVMKLSSPKKWRRDMTELLGKLRTRNPESVIFLSNCPMIKYSTAIPHPIKAILWELSQMHDANIKEFTREMDRVFYYPQPVDVPLDGFFADGIHPSEQGYKDWSAAMMRYFDEHYEWQHRKSK